MYLHACIKVDPTYVLRPGHLCKRAERVLVLNQLVIWSCNVLRCRLKYWSSCAVVMIGTQLQVESMMDVNGQARRRNKGRHQFVVRQHHLLGMTETTMPDTMLRAVMSLYFWQNRFPNEDIHRAYDMPGLASSSLRCVCMSVMSLMRQSHNSNRCTAALQSRLSTPRNCRRHKTWQNHVICFAQIASM